MKRGVKAYAEVLRLVRRLPPETRPYYSKYARENFVNYRHNHEADDGDGGDLFRRAYDHAIWVLSKYSVDVSAAEKLGQICRVRS